jgi:hypothetical protein
MNVVLLFVVANEGAELENAFCGVGHWLLTRIAELQDFRTAGFVAGLQFCHPAVLPFCDSTIA